MADFIEQKIHLKDEETGAVLLCALLDSELFGAILFTKNVEHVTCKSCKRRFF